MDRRRTIFTEASSTGDGGDENDKDRKYQQKDFRAVKNVLKASGDTAGGETNMYEHIKGVLNKVISMREIGFVDNLQKHSLKVKEEEKIVEQFTFEKDVVCPKRLEYAKQIISIYRDLPTTPITAKPAGGEEEEVAEEEDEELKTEVFSPDLMELQYYWNMAGLGIPGDEVYILTAAIRKLSRRKALSSCRFWGKIYGLRNNYLIAEATLTQDEIDRRLEDAVFEEEGLEELEQVDLDLEGQFATGEEMEEEGSMSVKISENPFDKSFPKLPTLPPLPKEVVTPSETYGIGTNKFVYYVANQPGEKWVELPLLTPKQVTVSRQITKYLTGNLSAPVISFPAFPGVERNYLRAIIERITAATYISPCNYYKFETDGDEAAGEEELDTTDLPIIENMEYEPVDSSGITELSNWAHHRPYLLPQGRINWIDIAEKDNEEEEEEDEPEMQEEEEKTPETGPPLLTTIDNDTPLASDCAWESTLVCSRDMHNTITICRSKNWPGAFAYTVGRIADCIYSGFGVKAVRHNYSPPHLPTLIMQCYPLGPEIMEMMDPSVEEEEAYRLAHLPKVYPLDDVDEGVEEEGFGEDDFAEEI